MFGTDKVSLVKQDGVHIDGIDADVQPKIIFIEDASLPIEEGDTILRMLPSGLEERYLVLDRGYWSGGSMRPHYQVKVRKETSIGLERQATTIYNLRGANPRVSVNSFDASVNVVTTSPASVFQEMKKVINDKMEDARHQAELLRHVDDMEQAQGTPSFVDRYQEFIAVAADHLTLLTPFLPALAQMLHH